MGRHGEPVPAVTSLEPCAQSTLVLRLRFGRRAPNYGITLSRFSTCSSAISVGLSRVAGSPLKICTRSSRAAVTSTRCGCRDPMQSSRQTLGGRNSLRARQCTRHPDQRYSITLAKALDGVHFRNINDALVKVGLSLLSSILVLHAIERRRKPALIHSSLKSPASW